MDSKFQKTWVVFCENAPLGEWGVANRVEIVLASIAWIAVSIRAALGFTSCFDSGTTKCTRMWGTWSQEDLGFEQCGVVA